MCLECADQHAVRDTPAPYSVIAWRSYLEYRRDMLNEYLARASNREARCREVRDELHEVDAALREYRDDVERNVPFHTIWCIMEQNRAAVAPAMRFKQ